MSSDDSIEAIAGAAYEIIGARNQPMTAAELGDALLNDGIAVPGDDRERTLSAMFGRPEAKLVKLSSGKFWLADRPYEQAHFIPAPDATTSNGDTSSLDVDDSDEDDRPTLQSEPES